MDDLETRKLDAVKMMREIRDKISKETMDMNFEELSKYVSKKLENSEVVKDKPHTG